MTQSEKTRPAAWMIIAPGCEVGICETMEGIALSRAAREYPPGTRVEPLYFGNTHPTAMTGEAGEVVAELNRAIAEGAGELAERSRDLIEAQVAKIEKLEKLVDTWERYADASLGVGSPAQGDTE